ncbi:hypothetical protein Aduo_015681 [Ancylostoma duodenale]
MEECSSSSDLDYLVEALRQLRNFESDVQRRLFSHVTATVTTVIPARVPLRSIRVSSTFRVSFRVSLMQLALHCKVWRHDLQQTVLRSVCT